MTGRTLGIVLLVVGLVVLIICLAADALGVGSNPGLGWKQIVGAVVGAAVAVVGLFSVCKGRAQE